ncbi:MFS transporter [Solemya velum gill symbiont]|uniref:MFS transporter n=1 Tax=Solemya velum gill symbiont TaxID=2340 RepID=A0A1T2CMW7_SOVGS|nr:twin transmembrane helix small protein [Solemya velum gill symbiont]OOY36176.1 MFS transporter [Solemya velum gill symbiont]OOY38117.1 MFS transporter [Solemya velum gill symbiont]OOY39921.1 MFS transporter [Solemya velum gill symbiont]OOY42076.1 MFS transporter [Solemya velum gill symbiont]OOY44673.1 MFS transporter [Solemya velum gill symbiont]
MIKTLIIINLVLILASLGSGMLFLAKDDGKGNRVVTSLTIRVALSFTLIGLILVGYFSGNLVPHQIQ